ncbi:MAG: M3 family metallopeptidase [Holophagales bacterium]|nr:M3 family metallopeptidase [Holophagales bacterium]
MAAATGAASLLEPWPDVAGIGVGLPPFERLEPRSLEEALERALDERREFVAAIASSQRQPTFENTVEALELSAVPLARLGNLLRHLASTGSGEEMLALHQRMAPRLAALEDEIAGQRDLLDRIAAVLEQECLTAERRRLTEVLRERLRLRGASLEPEARTRWTQVNARLSELQVRFMRNLTAEQDALVLWLADEDDLDGLGAEQRAAMADAANKRGRPGQWALPIQRPMVWPFLTRSRRRDLREKVWKLWMGRGANDGEHDNRPVMAEILRLRGEKARLLGYPSYADLAMATRMAADPQEALDLLLEVWRAVEATTRRQLTELHELARADGLDGELQAWDRLYYAEKHRQSSFGLDADAVRPYLSLDAVKSALFWSAERLYGLRFRRLDEAPVYHPEVEAFLVHRGDDPLGVLWLDLHQREGKSPGSWQAQLQARSSHPVPSLVHTVVVSSLPRPRDGEPALLVWELANVLFHEFGHALHMLLCRASYPSLGSLAVEWDFIELPALLNERWLRDRELLSLHARHVETGEPMPEELVASLDEALRYDRIFSLTLEYLATAIVDLRLHQLADGRAIDAMAVEEEVLSELGVPAAVEPLLRGPHAVHTFSEEVYAAGVYSYLWADVLAAEAGSLFEQTPGGLWEPRVADRYRETILEAGSTAPAAELFRALIDRAPSPNALLDRFGL